MFKKKFFSYVAILIMLFSCGENDNKLESNNKEVEKYSIEQKKGSIIISYNRPKYHSDSSITVLLFGKQDSLRGLTNEVSYPSFVMLNNTISLKVSFYDSIVKGEGYIPFIEEYLFNTTIDKESYSENSTISDVLDYNSEKVKESTFVLIDR